MESPSYDFPKELLTIDFESRVKLIESIAEQAIENNQSYSWLSQCIFKYKEIPKLLELLQAEAKKLNQDDLSSKKYPYSEPMYHLYVYPIRNSSKIYDLPRGETVYIHRFYLGNVSHRDSKCNYNRLRILKPSEKNWLA